MGDKNPSDTHVLNDEWTFYLNERPPKGISQEEYERSIHKWGVFATIEVCFSLLTASEFAPQLIQLPKK